jgi:hypothetical protein
LCGAGFLHPESYSFLPHYLSGRPFLELIFDNRVTDWGNYQARELAFVFDWLDAHFIEWCVRRGWVHFFSATHYVFLGLGGAVLWRICTRYLQLDRVVAFLLVLLLWSSPSAMLYTSFYRAAKVGSLLSVLVVIWAWLRARERPGWSSALVLLVAAALLPMFDKQGFIFLVWLVLLLTQQAFARRGRAEYVCLGAAVVALGLAGLYQRALGPWLAWKFVGIPLNLEYASVPWRALVSDSKLVLTVAAGGPLMALDSFRIPLGHLSLGLALLGVWWVWRQAPTASERRLFLVLCAFVCGLFAVMLMIFPEMLSSEHRRFFYVLPVLGIWLPVAAAALAAFARRRPEQAHWLSIVALALVAGNLFALQEDRFILRHGKYQPYCENAERVRAALRGDGAGISREDAAALLPKAEYYRDAVPPSLREDRIFLLLRQTR